MSATHIQKILHSASQDIEVLGQYCDVGLVNLYDTQLAAEFCGKLPQTGYANLVKELLDIDLNKGKLSIYSRNIDKLGKLKIITIPLITVNPVTSRFEQKDSELCIFQPNIRIKLLDSTKSLFPFQDNTNYENFDHWRTRHHRQLYHGQTQ